MKIYIVQSHVDFGDGMDSIRTFASIDDAVCLYKVSVAATADECGCELAERDISFDTPSEEEDGVLRSWSGEDGEGSVHRIELYSQSVEI